MPHGLAGYTKDVRKNQHQNGGAIPRDSRRYRRLSVTGKILWVPRKAYSKPRKARRSTGHWVREIVLNKNLSRETRQQVGNRERNGKNTDKMNEDAILEKRVDRRVKGTARLFGTGSYKERRVSMKGNARKCKRGTEYARRTGNNANSTRIEPNKNERTDDKNEANSRGEDTSFSAGRKGTGDAKEKKIQKRNDGYSKGKLAREQKKLGVMRRRGRTQREKNRIIFRMVLPYSVADLWRRASIQGRKNNQRPGGERLSTSGERGISGGRASKQKSKEDEKRGEKERALCDPRRELKTGVAKSIGNHADEDGDQRAEAEEQQIGQAALIRMKGQLCRGKAQQGQSIADMEDRERRRIVTLHNNSGSKEE
ncbi:hypothetical protein C8F01DRAFT_1085349 [Mycena amicta]|nr:hypothetical protein C8F01DRAFT_1085349 [Mycena amicta]